MPCSPQSSNPKASRSHTRFAGNNYTRAGVAFAYRLRAGPPTHSHSQETSKNAAFPLTLQNWYGNVRWRSRICANLSYRVIQKNWDFSRTAQLESPKEFMVHKLRWSRGTQRQNKNPSR